MRQTIRIKPLTLNESIPAIVTVVEVGNLTMTGAESGITSIRLTGANFVARFTKEIESQADIDAFLADPKTWVLGEFGFELPEEKE